MPLSINKKNLKASYKNIVKNSIFEEAFFNSNETYVHETAIIGPNVTLEQGVKVGPFCTIFGNVKIDENTKIYSNVSIGSTAQHTQVDKPLGRIEIGKNCNIREFVSIGSCATKDGKTRIGNNCYVMSYSHIAHDVTLEDNVVLINNANLGGHTYIEKNAFLMANAATHQFCRIGQFTSLAPYSGIRQDLPPFCLFSGQPAKFFGLNRVALQRAGFSKEDINSIKHIAKLFYQDKLLLKNIKELLNKPENQSWATNKHVQTFLTFIENSSRGVSKK